MLALWACNLGKGRLFNTQPRNPVVRIYHTLVPHAALVTVHPPRTAAVPVGPSALAGPLAPVLARRAAPAGAVPAVAARPGTPGGHVALQGGLHDGAVVHAHAGAHGASLEADGVEVVVAAALAVDAARDLGHQRKQQQAHQRQRRDAARR